MGEVWFIPGIGNVPTPSNPTSLPSGAVRVDGGGNTSSGGSTSSGRSNSGSSGSGGSGSSGSTPVGQVWESGPIPVTPIPSSGSGGGTSGGGSSVPSYQKHINWFGSPKKYAEEIMRSENVGRQLDDPASATAFRAAYPQLFASTTTQPTQPTQSITPINQPTTQPITPINQPTTTANNWPYYEQLLLNLLNQPSAYSPPTSEQMLNQADQFASLQVDPVLSSISSMIANAMSNTEKGKTSINADYSGMAELTKNLLGEARHYAEEDAISRNMGRSGVVNWETEKRTTPIMQQAQRTEAEKESKLAGLDTDLATALAEADRMRNETEGRRGTLKTSKLSELEQVSKSMAQQAQAQKWQQATGIATLAMQDKSIDQSLLVELLNKIFAA